MAYLGCLLTAITIKVNTSGSPTADGGTSIKFEDLNLSVAIFTPGYKLLSEIGTLKKQINLHGALPTRHKDISVCNRNNIKEKLRDLRRDKEGYVVYHVFICIWNNR